MPTRSPTAKRSHAGAARVDDADDLVARDDAGVLRRQITLGEVQIGAAHTARVHADPNLARGRAPGSPRVTRSSGCRVDRRRSPRRVHAHIRRGRVMPLPSG